MTVFEAVKPGTYSLVVTAIAQFTVLVDMKTLIPCFVHSNSTHTQGG